MPINKKLLEALKLCGFITGEKQESRLMNVIGVILRLQQDPPIPLTFSDIYEQLQKDEPQSKLTKAWVHRIVKRLTEMQMIRVENPTAHRKKYIADVNTIMAGFEQLKSTKIQELEELKRVTEESIVNVTVLDCGHLSKEFIREITGRKEEISSRIVRGVDELHRVLRFNMLERAGEGDIIRATLLWIGPFMNETVRARTMRFFEAAERGADVRYLVSTDIFKAVEDTTVRQNIEGLTGLIELLVEMRSRGIKFDGRFYVGPKTYNQISINNESMALIIAENPVTATWITREFNPDLIDNAVESFDKDWKKGKSVLDLTSEDYKAFGVEPEGLIRKVLTPDRKEE